MKFTSSAFTNTGRIPPRYTCDGEDVSPPLTIAEPPEGTVAFVIIVEDPDAPGGTWDHWVIFNVPPDTREITEGAKLEGIAGANSWGRVGYGGPCPPQGEHRYLFTAYALGSMLDAPAGSDKGAVMEAMEGHVLAEATLVGRYARE